MLRINDGTKTLQGLTMVVGSGLVLTEDTDGFPKIDVTPSAPGTTFESALNILANTSPGGHRQLRFIDRTTATKYNWMIGTQAAGDDIEITPSTTVGGTTFSNPAIKFVRSTLRTISYGGVRVEGINAAHEIVSAASGTHGAAAYVQWYRADGTTVRGYVGFGTNNDPRLDIMSVHGGARIYTNNVRAIDIDTSANTGIGTDAIGTARLHVVGGNFRTEYGTSTAGKLGIHTSTDQFHHIENAYYDGSVFKTLSNVGGGNTGQAVMWQSNLPNGFAMRIYSDQVARATDATRTFAEIFQIDVNGNTKAFGSASNTGKFTPNRMILPVGVDKWAT
jgi:hypothetical protein